MTPRDIALVQESFAKIMPVASQTAEIFHDRLSEIAPGVASLFRGALAGQGGKLMTALGVVIAGLKDFDSIMPAAKALAARHVGYGATPAQYAPVGEALVWTLEHALGPDFTKETKNAWLAAYGALSGVAIAEAYGAAA